MDKIIDVAQYVFEEYKQIGDLKANYEDLYVTILEKLENFNRNMIDNAL